MIRAGQTTESRGGDGADWIYGGPGVDHVNSKEPDGSGLIDYAVDGGTGVDILDDSDPGDPVANM